MLPLAQELWQVLYYILPIIFLKELIKLNVNTGTVIKNEKLLEFHMKHATVDATCD